MNFPPIPFHSATWREQARELLQEYLYGELPPIQSATDCVLAAHGSMIAHEVNLGTWQEYALQLPLQIQDQPLTIHTLVCLPGKSPKGWFAGINFHGNHSISDISGIPLARGFAGWESGDESQRSSEHTRNLQPNAFPVVRLLAEGYGLVTFFASDVAPDHLRLSQPFRRIHNETVGNVGIWAWGLASVVKALQSGRQIEGPVHLIGHSRLGKAALCCGAMYSVGDSVISIQSGTGGAAPSRTRIGEPVPEINRVFPHWFNQKYKDIESDPDQLPFDQHWALALCAPKKVLVLNAAEDLWADPDGSTKMVLLASPAWVEPGNIQAHTRPGVHVVNQEDWDAILSFVGN